MHASIQVNSSTSSDVLAELFKEGSVDPSLLMIHPCPPGKKDKSMRSDLMEFQVSQFGLLRMPGWTKVVNIPVGRRRRTIWLLLSNKCEYERQKKLTTNFLPVSLFILLFLFSQIRNKD